MNAKSLVKHYRHLTPAERFRLILAAGVRGEEGFDELEIADRNGVEDHGIGTVVVSRAVEVVEGGPLGVAEIVQDGAGGANGGGPVGKAATIESEELEMIAQGSIGVIGGEDPVFELRADKAEAAAIFAGQERQVARE